MIHGRSSLFVQALVDCLEEQVNVLARWLILKRDNSALCSLCLVLEPVERRYEHAVTFLECCLQDVVTDFSQEREPNFSFIDIVKI